MAHVDLENITTNEYATDPRKQILAKKRALKVKRRQRIAIIIVLLLLIIAFFTTDISKVKSVKVKGNSIVPESLILSTANIDKSDYYFLLKKKSIQSDLEKIGLVKEAHVSTDFIGNITINVTESELIAYANVKKVQYAIDEKGHLLHITKSMSIDHMKYHTKVTGFKKLSQLQEFVKEFVKIPLVTRNNVSDVKFSPTKTEDKRVIFIMDNGKKLILRVNEISYVLNKKRFNYEAFMKKYGEYNTFTFYGRNLYVSK